MRLLVPLLIAAIATSSCGGNSGTPPASPPSTGPDIPISGSQRLAWSQMAPTLDVVRSYAFLLYVDGARTPLTGVSCTAAGDGFECTAPLPALTSGRHVLELSAQDPRSGLESDRSAPLGVTRNAQSSLDRRRLTAQDSTPRGDASPPADIRGCIDGPSGICFSTSVIADNLDPVARMVALPDERLLVLFAGGVVRILPNGAPERLDIGRLTGPVDVADVAVDPDFQTNRYVYLAVVGAGSDGRHTVTVVRMRELADRLGEAATLVADLPTGDGRPAVSLGPDSLLYIAVPSSDRQSNTGGPYDGLVLRLTRDGRAAGHERLASPVFSTGRARPVAFAWLDREHLLLGASDGLGVVRVGMAQSEWPASMAVMRISSMNDPEALKAVARGRSAESTASLFILGSAPSLLYLATLTTGPQNEIRSMDPIPLGRFIPAALAVGTNGDPIIAGSEEPGAPVRLLRLRLQ